MRDDRELTLAVQRNPWARAVWERKHPAGPVLVIWQVAPLSLYVASWLKFAGNRCMPSHVGFASAIDSVDIDSMVDRLGETAFADGPSAKMIEQSNAIARSYAERGKKGGRPKKTINRPSGADATESISPAIPFPSALRAQLASGPKRDQDICIWSELRDSELPSPVWQMIPKHSPEAGFIVSRGKGDTLTVWSRRVVGGKPVAGDRRHADLQLDTCLKHLEILGRVWLSTYTRIQSNERPMTSN